MDFSFNKLGYVRNILCDKKASRDNNSTMIMKTYTKN